MNGLKATAFQRCLIGFREWTPVNSRRSLQAWLCAWALVIIGSVGLNYATGRHLWTPVLLYPVLSMTILPAWLKSRRYARRRVRQNAPQIPSIDWVVAMFVAVWLMFVGMVLAGW